MQLLQSDLQIMLRLVLQPVGKRVLTSHGGGFAYWETAAVGETAA